MVPVEGKLRFEKQDTLCLIEWEVRAALEEGLDAYGFVRKIRTLELEAPMLVPDPDTLIQFILEPLSAEDLQVVCGACKPPADFPRRATSLRERPLGKIGPRGKFRNTGAIEEKKGAYCGGSKEGLES